MEVFSRKEFLGSIIAGSIFPPASSASYPKPSGKPFLKLGVLSDLHITDEAATLPFEEVLRKFDRSGVDGVLVCGDLTDYGVVPQLEALGRAWFRVFPGGKGCDGRKIANLMHYGDHDTQGFTWRNCKACVAMYPDEAAMKEILITTNDRKATWERIFDEEWNPIMHKIVKGYDFVLANFTREHRDINPLGDATPGLADFLKGLHLDPTRPFFYSQHRIFRNTVCGKYAWGQDDGSAGDLLSRVDAGAIAFCGHGHQSAVSELNIWQGGFTALQVPSLRYCTTLGGRENGTPSSAAANPYTMRAIDGGQGKDFTRQGYLIDVYDKCMVVSRWDFKSGVSLGPDWTVPLSSSAQKSYALPGRLDGLPLPRFRVDAAVSAKEIKARDRAGEERDMLELSFPLADAEVPMANDYEVRVETEVGDVVQTVASRRFYPENYFYGMRIDMDKVVCRMLQSDIPKGVRTKVVVTAMDAFGRRGSSIVLRK